MTDEDLGELTLKDIDAMTPLTKDGTVYSDLYKAHYGQRPKGITWSTIEEFDRDLAYLMTHEDGDDADDDSEHDYDRISLRDDVGYDAYYNRGDDYD